MKTGIDTHRQTALRRRGIWAIMICSFVWMTGVSAPRAYAATLTVCSSGCDYGTIQQAITNATAGDVIEVRDAARTEAGISVTKDLTIQGLGIGLTTVQAAASEGTASNRVFAISAATTVTIQDMTIRYGKVTGDPARGGGIYNEGSLTLDTVTVTGCQAMADSKAYAYGGGICSSGTLNILDSTVSNNTAKGGNSFATFDGGHAYGGGIYTNSTATLTDCTISGNTATGGHELIAARTAGSASGGGIYSDSGQSLTITRGTFDRNTANGGRAEFDFAHGGHAYGGGLYNNGTAVLTQSTFSTNEANGGHAIIEADNGGHAYGGGLYSNEGCFLTVTKSTISGNTVHGGDALIGGGSGQGGGVSQAPSGTGTLTFTNSTFSENNARKGTGAFSHGTGDGGGLWGSDGMTLTCCTVAANIADTSGDGVFSDAGAGNGPEIENSLFADNDGHDLYGHFQSADYNLIENTSGCTLTGPTGNNVTGQDPLLSALASNGGPTQTMAIAELSPARDQGTCSCDGVDQRGVTRPYGSDCDIGAYERTSQTLVELASFTADGFHDRVVLSWETASEIDHAGFHLWRSEKADAGYGRMTDALIPAEGGPAWGAAYTHEDTDVAPGKRYYYKLEDIDASGARTFHGPVLAWPGVVNLEVNGADSPATVPASEPVSVKVSVRPEEGAKAPEEWWLCCDTPFGWFSYVNPKGWVPGIQLSWANPQIPIDNLEVLNGPLPPGDYRFHFALDSRVDGRAPAPMFSRDVFLLDELSLKGESHQQSSLQQLNRWQTCGPDWHDSVEVRVE